MYSIHQDPTSIQRDWDWTEFLTSLAQFDIGSFMFFFFFFRKPGQVARQLNEAQVATSRSSHLCVNVLQLFLRTNIKRHVAFNQKITHYHPITGPSFSFPSVFFNMKIRLPSIPPKHGFAKVCPP